MGDFNGCFARGTLFFIAASKGSLSQITISVTKYSFDEVEHGSEDQQELSSFSLLMILLVIFGIEQGWSYIRTLNAGQAQPCWEETLDSEQKDVKDKHIELLEAAPVETVKDRPVESLLSVDEAFSAILEEVNNGVVDYPPRKSDDGTSGVYFFSDNKGEEVAVFKPVDEEGCLLDAQGAEIKPGCSYGEGYLKEAAAFLLDRDGFHGIPRTAVARCSSDLYGSTGATHKLGSLQEFVPSKSSAEDMGPSKFQTQDVHKIGLLDCRILNLDRHLGNILVSNNNSLVPIDHGLSFPSRVSGDALFEWLQFPQSKQPFSKETVEYICNIDVDSDAAMLREKLPDMREECIKVMYICTMFLKKAVAKGKNLYEIGTMMSRYSSAGEEVSLLENIDMRVKERMAVESNKNEVELWNEEIDRVI